MGTILVIVGIALLVCGGGGGSGRSSERSKKRHHDRHVWGAFEDEEDFNECAESPTWKGGAVNDGDD